MKNRSMCNTCDTQRSAERAKNKKNSSQSSSSSSSAAPMALMQFATAAAAAAVSKSRTPISSSSSFKSDLVVHSPAHGYCILQPTQCSLALARRWQSLSDQRKVTRLGAWADLVAVGSGQQLDVLAQTESDFKNLVGETEQLFRNVLPPYFLDQYAEENRTQVFHIPAMKMLFYDRAADEQTLHHDVCELAVAKQRWSVIFYLQDTISTAMPTHDADRLQKLWSFESLSPVEREELTDKKHWTSFNVRAGSILIFRQTVAHFGVPDPKKNRAVIFALISPSNAKGQDEFQSIYY